MNKCFSFLTRLFPMRQAQMDGGLDWPTQLHSCGEQQWLYQNLCLIRYLIVIVLIRKGGTTENAVALKALDVSLGGAKTLCLILLHHLSVDVVFYPKLEIPHKILRKQSHLLAGVTAPKQCCPGTLRLYPPDSLKPLYCSQLEHIKEFRCS